MISKICNFFIVIPMVALGLLILKPEPVAGAIFMTGSALYVILMDIEDAIKNLRR